MRGGGGASYNTGVDGTPVCLAEDAFAGLILTTQAAHVPVEVQSVPIAVVVVEAPLGCPFLLWSAV